MRKIVAWPLCWSLYWLGHWVSKPMNWCDFLARLYPVYNRLMIWSGNIQDWGQVKSGPWKYNDDEVRC